MKLAAKLKKLRSKMKENGIDAYVVPGSDPHMSEYMADCWNYRRWISDFTGSAGIVIITQDHAGLWTDGRYYVQAKQELDSKYFTMHKMETQFRLPYIDWLTQNLNKGQTVGLNSSVLSYQFVQSTSEALKSNGINLNTEHKLVEDIWEDRPPRPKTKVFLHEKKYAGLTAAKKLSSIREMMKKNGTNAYYVNTLDDIGWLLNIRGADVDYNPVSIAFLIILEDMAYYFTDTDKIDQKVAKYLAKLGIEIKPYSDIDLYLNVYLRSNDFYWTPQTTPYNHAISIKQSTNHAGPNLLMHAKAIKNKTEISWFRKVMVKDGVALLRFYKFIDEHDNLGSLNESDLVEKLVEYRSHFDTYFGESFHPIVGYQSNGAINHYRPTRGKDKPLSGEGILLIDSGGQYHDGTTDTTRTIPLGKPTKEQQANYTRVLKGHIALDQMVFPEGTTGGQLDVLARQYLWKVGLNYSHGTGHGIGFFMNVHEPPQGFTAGPSSRSNTVLKKGMITSNEPGYYLDGEYGIRLENLIIAVESKYKGFLEFENVTLFPFDRRMVLKELLTGEELNWINSYHKRVLEALSPHLETSEKNWLKKQCKKM